MANKSADISVYDTPIVLALTVICGVLWFIAAQLSMG